MKELLLSFFLSLQFMGCSSLPVPSDRCLVTVYSSAGEQFLCIPLCAWNTNNPVHGFHFAGFGSSRGRNERSRSRVPNFTGRAFCGGSF